MHKITTFQPTETKKTTLSTIEFVDFLVTDIIQYFNYLDIHGCTYVHIAAYTLCPEYQSVPINFVLS